MKYLNYEALKLTNGSSKLTDDNVVLEAPLQININNAPYTVVMRTPGDDLELIRGLLYAEDIYKGKKTPIFRVLENSNHQFSIIDTQIPSNQLGKGYLNKRTLLSVSSCGVCGTQTLDGLKITGEKLKKSTKTDHKLLTDMFVKMESFQTTFQQTGASHAAALFDKKNTLLSIKEDIGRHNAVDKTVGDLLMKNTLDQTEYLLVSGRVSYEIITKAFLAKIPTVVAVSGCSSLAIDYAKEFGIKLIGFFRGASSTTYSF